MKENSTYYLTKLKRKYLMLRLTEILIFAFSVACVVYGLCLIFHFSGVVRLIASMLAGGLIFIIRYHSLKLGRLTESRLLAYINHRYPEMEQSADLLIADQDNLTSLQEIQRERAALYFRQVYPIITLPHQLGKAVIVLGVSLIATFI